MLLQTTKTPQGEREGRQMPNSLTSAEERQAERRGHRDHGTNLSANGAADGGHLHGEWSVGSWRTGKRQTHKPFAATSPARFGARPSAGRVADIEQGNREPGADDGSAMMAEFRAGQSATAIPAAKTPMQSRLRESIMAWNSGERTPQRRTEIAAKLATIGRTDEPQASKLAASIRGWK